MPITTPLATDPRPLPASKERRTFDLRFISERNGQQIVVAQREDWVLAADGSPIGEPVRNGQVRRDITPAFLAANPDDAALLQSLLDRIDAWDAEDSAANPTEPQVLTVEQRMAVLVAAVQKHMDETARTRNYDGILSLCSYASSTVPKFFAEATAGVEWRDACWAFCYSLLAEVQAETAEEPTASELVAALPTINW